MYMFIFFMNVKMSQINKNRNNLVISQMKMYSFIQILEVQTEKYIKIGPINIIKHLSKRVQ